MQSSLLRQHPTPQSPRRTRAEMSTRALIACIATLLVLAGPAASLAQSLDPFGQLIDPATNAAVDKAKTLRLPYGKTPDAAKRDAQKAVAMLEPIIAAKPDYYRALFNLGLAYDEAGNYAKANAAFERAFAVRDKLKIQDISLLNSAGWVSMKNGDYATAEKRLQSALANITQGTPPTQASLYNNLGQLYYDTQRFDEAGKYLTIAKDRFNSKAAAETLDLIAKTNALFNVRRKKGS